MHTGSVSPATFGAANPGHTYPQVRFLENVLFVQWSEYFHSAKDGAIHSTWISTR